MPVRRAAASTKASSPRSTPWWAPPWARCTPWRRTADDVVGHLVDGPVGVDDDEALRLGLSQGEELLAQGHTEGVPLLLKAVLGAAAGGASFGQVGVAVEQDGQVRQEALGGPQGEVADLLGTERAGRTLVGDGGVEVAVGQDDGAALEGGPHAGGDVVGAVGGVQEGLGARRDVPAVQEEAADLDAELRAARFAGEDVVHVRRGQKVGEDADLRRLADAVASLEGDEQTGAGRTRNGGAGSSGRGSSGHGPRVTVHGEAPGSAHQSPAGAPGEGTPSP